MALALGEGLARVLHPLSTVEYRMESDIGPILVPNQQSRWVNEDYDVEILTNNAGFHDVDHTIEKPEGMYRIVVLGDSYVEALQVSLEEGFTQRLERNLSTWVTGRRVEVINLGVSGSGPAQYYRTLDRKGLAYRPDLVLMAVLPDNDFRDSYQELSGAVFKPYYSIRVDGTLDYIPPDVSGLGTHLRPLLRRSAFLHLVRQAVTSMPVENWLANAGLLAPAGAKNQYSAHSMIPEDWYVYVADPPEPWPAAYRVTLRMIKESSELAARHGAVFLVMLLASPQTVEDRWEEALRRYPGASHFTWDFRRPYREISRIGEQSGFKVINLLESFQKDYHESRRSHSWPHDGHWNQDGHRLAADVVSRYLFEHRNRYQLN